ncbi:hypothetical protein DEFDS_0298 [Deferribacter desulfuricans SSM1]|uniref:PepSY domain-containing protein n=1 Tax=Deferribacter desulfuricans (strain DSM 14783 / JCM 11476 / NBRC 101012 / SSM1) TaxID=639282 RepID=D3PB29_DEFDS|nr:hypothetical protein [Deferribacter desulfuricans]BAI79802.1 hypothetical protein DEFDS_0298 [Deferribacter desulfuricans SSM1]
MKKVFLTLLGVVGLIFILSYGYAWMGPWGGYGYNGYAQGYSSMMQGPWMDYCMDMHYGQAGAGVQISKEVAVKNVKDLLASNYPGWKVENVESFRMPMGTMYNVVASDKSGNKFMFRVNPWGYVMGPFQLIN